ncbi:hypothetical protein LP420_12620 [Massilia sp. B-10]|nr:hypothetical protein LP420_12620 [Massilia sp. B-10]
MNKHTTLLALATTTLATAAVLTACGGGGGGDSTPIPAQLGSLSMAITDAAKPAALTPST